MANRKLGTAVGASILSVAGLTYVSCQSEGSFRTTPRFKNKHQASDNNENNDYLIAKAERLLEETGNELRLAAQGFKNGVHTTAHDAKVSAMVLGRFVDLMTRSGMAIVDYKLYNYMHKTQDDQEPDKEAKLAQRALHKRNAESLHDACAQHGGLLVKMGQYLATTASTVLPPEYSEALSRLQDSCAPLEYEQVRECIEAELSRVHGSKAPPDGSSSWIDSVFVDIDQEPLGSASLAQVHAATLKDGRRVALKVQRPNLDRTTKADFVALSVLSKAVERAFPGSGFDWLLPEFHKSITAELDFTQEAKNTERCQKMLRGVPLTTDTSLVGFLRDYGMTLLLGSIPFWHSKSRRRRPPETIVPRPIADLTSSRMLVMSFEEGFRITDLEQLKKNNIDSRRVAAATCSLFAELMMVHGFVHSDPHAGNILVRPRQESGDFDLVLLDHGMYRRLDEKFRTGYSQLWSGLVAGGDAAALKGVQTLGLPDAYLDLMGLMLTYRVPSSLTGKDSPLRRHKLGTVMGKSTRQELKKFLQEKYGEDVLSPKSLNQVLESQSRDLLFCLRCTNLVRGLNQQLGGTTLDRFIAFGSAGSRGASLEVDMTTQEASEIVSSTNDLLAQAKASLNQPVASELLAQRRNLSTQTDASMLIRTFDDYWHMYKISMRNWWKSMFVDLLVTFSGAAPIELSKHRLG